MNMKKILMLVMLLACFSTVSVMGQNTGSQEKYNMIIHLKGQSPVAIPVQEIDSMMFLPAQHIELTAPEIANHINKPFADFVNAVNDKFHTTFKANEPMALDCVCEQLQGVLMAAPDKSGMLVKATFIPAVEQGRASGDAWKLFLENATGQWGAFYGTKFVVGELSGVKKTIEETLTLAAGDNYWEGRIAPIFGIVSGVYFSPKLQASTFTLEFVRNYYRLDLPQLAALMMTDFNDFVEANYFISNKINLFGMLYAYFDAVKDADEHPFTMNVTATPDASAIKEISVYLAKSLTNEEAVAVYTRYAQNHVSYGLTQLLEAYGTDAFGNRAETFATIDEAVEAAKKHNKQAGGGIIIRFVNAESPQVIINWVLNASDVYFLLQEAPKVERPKMAIEYVAEYNLTSDNEFAQTHDNGVAKRYKWSDAVERFANVEIGGVRYHLPSKHELAAIVPPYGDGASVIYKYSSSHTGTSEAVEVNKVKKTYSASYLSKGGGICYALRFGKAEQAAEEGFEAAADNSMLCAYRYERMGDFYEGNTESRLKVTVCHLGKDFKGTIGNIADEAWWKDHASETIERIFPASGYDHEDYGEGRYSGLQGYCWSSTANGESTSWGMFFNNSHAYEAPCNTIEAYPVRLFVTE